jgi:hypothetical protein
MYRRILTALTVAVAAVSIAVPVAAAQQSTTNQKLEEIGAWAVPSQASPSRAFINSKLEEIGAWAVPSQTTTAHTAPAATSDGSGFNWNDGIAGAVVLGVMVVGTGLVVTMRRHGGPLAH